MEKQIKTIGVLTSGGDAPGMNAAVRAVVRTGLHKGFRMIGIQRGYNGLLNGECFEMNLRSVSNIISAGGTILYTARCLEFKTKEGQDKGAAKCRELGIDALVVIGGDGSYRGARELAHRGIPMHRPARHHRQRHCLHRLHHRLRYRYEYRTGDDRQAARYHPEP